MPDNLNSNNPNPGEFFGKRNQVDDEPVQPDKRNLHTSSDPFEIDLEEEDKDKMGDDGPRLSNDHEKPARPAAPAAEYDGIRDGDREAFDEIPDDDEEDDYPRTS